MKEKSLHNEKERDGEIYALYLQGSTYSQIKSKFNISVKKLRWIIKLEALRDISEKHPDISHDEAIRRAVAVSYK